MLSWSQLKDHLLRASPRPLTNVDPGDEVLSREKVKSGSAVHSSPQPRHFRLPSEFLEEVSDEHTGSWRL
jgi:hypothetical protein